MEPCAIIDPRLPEECKKNLRREGFAVIEAPLSERVDNPLSGHPDIQMFIHNSDIFVHPDIGPEFLKKIEKYSNIIHCSSRLEKTYPGDVPYNIACTGTAAFHRIVYTDKTIAAYLPVNGIELVDTRQGYSRCSTLIVDNRSIITSDRSINSAAGKAGLDSLLITPGYVELDGYNYGFIGGASGRFRDTVYLTGTIENHPDKERMEHFIEEKGMHLKILSGTKVFDSGSILFIG